MSQREQQVDAILERGVIVGVLPDKESFRERLISTKPMRIYIGADPTSSTLHVSHAKNYMLLEEFRQLGHEVIVLFGDFTARIGDPTDKLATRKQLTGEEVAENIKGWAEQIRPLMDFDDPHNPPRIKYNYDWLARLTMEDLVALASNITVQRMLERDMFQKRLKENKPIHVHEFLYPLMQGYDSVAMEVDAELCGTDQTFNALVGRTLLKRYKQKDKFVVTVNLMENPITGELMSKSRGTGIFLNFSPFDMYGAVMAQPDEMTRVFFVNNTRLPLAEVDAIVAGNPRDAKMRAAYELCKVFHGEDAARAAQDKFVSLVQKKEIVAEIPEVHIGVATATIASILRTCLPDEVSNSEIRRQILQRSVKVDGHVVEAPDVVVTIAEPGVVVKYGKKSWFRLRP